MQGRAKARAKQVAERGRFELPIGLHLCRISSAVHSTTLPPLRRLAWKPRSRGEIARGPWFHKTSLVGGVNLFGLKEAMMFFKAPGGTLSIDRAAMRL